MGGAGCATNRKNAIAALFRSMTDLDCSSPKSILLAAQLLETKKMYGFKDMPEFYAICSQEVMDFIQDPEVTPALRSSLQAGLTRYTETQKLCEEKDCKVAHGHSRPVESR